MREALQTIIAALAKHRIPEFPPELFPCFSEKELRDHPGITKDLLRAFAASLDERDIPTLERALQAQDEQIPAWLGFKIVTDAKAAVNSEDTDVVGIRGQGKGSADGTSGLFFASENKEIVFSRPYSERDAFQMLDITRGPHMHSEQYAGVSWLSVPLEQAGRAFIFGAGEVPLWVARIAKEVGFSTVVLDDDEAYLNAERFPASERILVQSYDSLSSLNVSKRDYVLVLTRGHMHDPEALVYGIQTGAHYVGMMGCAAKNEKVFAMAEAKGISMRELEATHSPIGLTFGAKTPPELALCIVAEMIQVRNERRKAGAIQ